jgi:hypothetical protein
MGVAVIWFNDMFKMIGKYHVSAFYVERLAGNGEPCSRRDGLWRKRQWCRDRIGRAASVVF